MTFGLGSVAVCVCEREENCLQPHSQGFSPRNYNIVTVASVCTVTNGYDHMHCTPLPYQNTREGGTACGASFYCHCVPLHKAGC